MLETVIKEQNALLAENNKLMAELIRLQKTAPVELPEQESTPAPESEKQEAPPAAEEPKTEPAPTLDDVRKALIDLSKRVSRDAAKEVVTRFGVEKAGDIKESDFAAVIENAKKYESDQDTPF